MRLSLSLIMACAFVLSASAAVSAQERTVERWERSTALMRAPDGSMVKKTVEYPVFKGEKRARISKAAEFNNCWDWCRRVCDGYGVCWLECGTHCSGW
jgi:hypothetical protein